MSSKIWKIAERLSDDIFEHLLLSRSLTTDEQQNNFFHPSISSLSSPDSFRFMATAVDRVMRAIEAQEPIVVWGDFDADGVTSTAILWETLHELGAKAMPYIPSRETEGHGFSEEGLQKLQSDGVKLIITVDHGISALEEVERIAALGMEVIVSDHHEPRLRQEAKQGQGVGGKGQANLTLANQPETESGLNSHPRTLAPSHPKFELPNAVAVIHPELMERPQPLAGCGVSYVLSYAIWLRMKGLKDGEAAREEFAQDKVELAGIGTIADMVPLKEDNRIFAALGLKALPKTSRVGLQRMMQLAGLQDKQSLSAYDVGFGIGPRLNAPGRLADALESLRLLCTKDERRAGRLAQELDALNKHRQDLLTRVTEEAKAEALKHEDGVYVLAKPNWPAGVCGLAAGKIVERYHRPAVVMEVMGETARGSARSIKGFDITAALSEIKDDLESYGGHAMAAGFVAKTEHLPLIERKLTDLLFAQLSEGELLPSLTIDAEVDERIFSWEFYDKLQLLEPCGMGNPRPVFVMKGLKLIDHRTVGADKKHLKLTLRTVGSVKREALSDQDLQSSSPAVQQSIEGIAFNLGYWADQLSGDSVVDVVFGMDKNEWNGRKSLQMLIKDLRLSGTQA